MTNLDLTTDQQHLLAEFVAQDPLTRGPVPPSLETLLREVMSVIDVRCLEAVNPEKVRELLRASFEAMKLGHLYENGLLSRGQLQSRIDAARNRIEEFA